MHVFCLVPGKIQPPIRRFIIPDDKRPKSQANDSYRLQLKLRICGTLPSLQQVLRDFDKKFYLPVITNAVRYIKIYLKA